MGEPSPDEHEPPRPSTAAPSHASGGERRRNGTDGTDGMTDGGEAHPPRYHPPPQERFDWRGWTLVAVVVVSFLVVPAAILYLPHVQGLVAAVGLSWYQAYIVLPMIPAILLGATAIWAAVGSR